MSFSKKKIASGEGGFMVRWKKYITPSGVLFGTVVIVAVVLVLFISKYMFGFASQTVNRFADSTIKLVTQQIGTPMQRDPFGHINILIAGYAGSDNRGGFLTDTLMLASFHPEQGTVTFLSIPRDLYVSYGRGASSKINSVYWSMYLAGGNDHELGISSLQEKVTEITGIDIPYYMMVDFDGFIEFIDTLGGIEVEVTEALYDNRYPGPNDSYVVFQVNPGVQQFDGDTALKFARSRMSTSDFSRSYRQQQIIAGVVEKIKGTLSLTNLGEVRSLYTKGMSMLRTNVGLEQILWLSQFSEQRPQFFSFVYEADCQRNTYSLAKPGCILNYGNRASFGGQSVMIPDGGSASNVSYYVKTQDIAHRLIHRQDVLQEKTPLSIRNGIDLPFARSQGYRVVGVADEVAVDLVLRGFNVEQIANADAPIEQTTLYVDNQQVYRKTIDALAAFVPYTQIIETDQYGSGVTIILGNDRLKRL